MLLTNKYLLHKWQAHNVLISAVNPDTNPDPAFQVNPDPDPGF